MVGDGVGAGVDTRVGIYISPILVGTLLGTLDLQARSHLLLEH